MSLRIVRSVTLSAAASVAVVVCRSLHRVSMIAVRRSYGFNHAHLPPKAP